MTFVEWYIQNVSKHPTLEEAFLAGRESEIDFPAVSPPSCSDLAAQAKRLCEYTTKTDRDPWKHRSKGMRCVTCMWFAVKATPEPPKERGALGRCRRNAPTMGGYPAVFETDWCGQHKLDETKI